MIVLHGRQAQNAVLSQFAPDAATITFLLYFYFSVIMHYTFAIEIVSTLNFTERQLNTLKK